MVLWTKINEWLAQKQKVILLCVIDSKGSSPGRTGFKMALNEAGELAGSIGGGIMEHKLVELCRQELLKRDFKPFIKKQIHQTNIPSNRSGMICSGEQTIAFYPLDGAQKNLVDELTSARSGVVTFAATGISFLASANMANKFHTEQEGDSWIMKEDIGLFPVLHVIGGGHVGLSLSRLAHTLGFVVHVYDDRSGLNTLEQNTWATITWVSDYETIRDVLPSGNEDYVAIMSVGYRSDKIILKQLLARQFRYLGMLGSKEKVKKLVDELASEGASQEQLDRVHAPIGIPISSKTPEEIAVSIMAEIIGVKNG